MKKRRPYPAETPDYGVGFPIGLIAFLMLAISTYLFVLNVQIAPLPTAVFVPADH
nr:hypothetical protein [uncultured Shinella sp.]